MGILWSTTEQYGDQEFDDEFCDPEIKLHPESVRFIPDDSEESEDEKLHRRQKMRPEDLITLTSHDSTPYGGQMLKYQLVVSEAPGNEPNEDLPAEQPLTEKVVFFGNYEAPDEYSAWYDCSLGRPAAREVRDSYDQFCHSPRDIGSRDSIDVLPHRKRALYEQQESKMMLVQKFDSNTSLVEKRNGSTASFRGSKFKAIAEEETSSEDVLRSGNLKRTRKLPSHHWSTPAVFTAQDGNNSNKDSDSDSVDSFRRGRKSRRMRPHSMYNNNKSVASSQQDDLRPKLQCICEHDAAEEEPQSEIAPTRTHKVKRVESVSSDRDSSYLHLEKRNSFLEQLQSWETDSDTGNKGCSPYDSHAKRNESESDSDRSISPAHSLVSLSDSESDRELAKKFHSSENKVEKRLSFVGEPDQTHLFRSVSYLKGVDSESASDGNSSDGQEKIDSKASSSSTNRVKTLPAVAEIQDVGRTDSLDQLKACDPFFRPPNQVSRAPSDASSGISSLQVSSSETNSIDSYSPCESRRSTRFSGGSSYSSGYGSSRSSYESQGTSYMKARDRLSKEANPPKSVKSSFPKLVEPYEWDASGLEDCDTEGTSYNAKRFDELMALQKQLGVELDSGSSNEDMRNSADLEKLSASALLKMQPKISPPRYKVDMLSDDEKDKRCSKLLAEYKTNKKVPSRKSPQTTVYRTWHL